MLKRLVGVITVRDGWAVQSIGYGRYLPLGRPEIIAENLDRWFLDEILVLCIDRTRKGLGPDTETLTRIGERGLMTPLAYGGGVATARQALDLVKLGADRICLEQAFDLAPRDCAEIRDAVGVQAVIRAMPLQIGTNGRIARYDYLTRGERSLDPEELAPGGCALFSELMVIDCRGDGGLEQFNPCLLAPFAALPFQIIAFGGITTRAQVRSLLARPELSAVAVGNSLSYRELANRYLIDPADMHDTRTTSHGAQSRGARQW